MNINEFMLDVNMLLVQSMPDDALSLFRFVIETNADPRRMPWWLSINHVYGYDSNGPVLDNRTRVALLEYIRARQTAKAVRLSISRRITGMVQEIYNNDHTSS